MPSTADLRAVADGNADAAPALQRALDARGTVHVPPGRYRIGRTLRVGSNTRLLLHPQATLRLADGVGRTLDDFLLTNADHERGNEGIEVRGGTFDGNNRGNPRTPGALIDPGSYTGVLINFRNVRHLTFAHALLCDAETYHFRATQIGRFLVEHVRFHSTNPRPNNDGIHLGGNCSDGIIRHLRGLGPGAPSDDLVALNADDALERIECQGKTRGSIRNLTIHDLRADQCHSFVRILSTDSPIEHIDISGIRGGCTESALNMDGARGCRVQVFDAADPKYARGVGDCRDIRVGDIVVFKATANSRSPLIRLQQRVDGLTLTGFRRDTSRDGSPAAPTLDARFLDRFRLHLEGVDASRVDGLKAASSVAFADSRDGLTTTLDYSDAATLPAGGFDRLAVDAAPDRN